VLDCIVFLGPDFLLLFICSSISYFHKPGSIAGTVTRLQAGQCGVQILAGARYFSPNLPKWL
jgi:hypothetical protein